MIGVYEIINLADGKMTSYVGSSADMVIRWAAHIRALRGDYHDNPHLQAAWDKYGEGAFSFCVLERVEREEDLPAREQDWLDRAFEVGDTYNICREAQFPPARAGQPRTEETKRKISEAQSGENNPMWGKHHTEETKRKMSEAHKGRTRRPFSKGWRHKLAEASARPYPAFVHRETGEVIPPGRNLKKLCKERGLTRANMSAVAHCRCKHHRGWELALC